MSEPSFVWKFPIPFADTFSIDMPAGAKLLHVAEQHRDVCLWALVNPTATKEPRYFRIAGTGHPIDTSDQQLQHVGTWLMESGRVVFHLFEIV